VITVHWQLAGQEPEQCELGPDEKWEFGREADPQAAHSVTMDEPALSRSALVVRDSGPGPLVFRGQRDNGMRVEVVSDDGQSTPLEEGLAHHLTADARTIVVGLKRDEPFVTVTVDFENRGSVVERRDGHGSESASEAPEL